MSSEVEIFAQWLGMQIKQVSVEELSRDTGLHTTTIYDIARNKRDVRLSSFVKLTQALGHTPADVMGNICQ